MTHSIITALLLTAMTSVAVAQTPQQSYAGAPDGVAAPFEGEWAAFRPGGEDSTIIICPSPVIIRATGDASVEYGTASSTPTPFDLTAADGRTTWIGGGETATAVWIEPDEFHLVPVTAGEPDWAEVLVYHRCAVSPRTSYAGAPDGQAAPFAGRWALETPSTTGNRPNPVLAACDGPVIVASEDETTLTFTNPEGAVSTVTVSAHDGHTDWSIEGETAPWEVVWIDPDRFDAHLLGIFGTTDWRQPFILTRCDG